MQMISIREVRGSELLKYSQQGELVGIQNNRSLIGIILPANSLWTQKVVEANWSRLTQGLKEGEREISDGTLPTSLESLQAELIGRPTVGDIAPTTSRMSHVRIGDLSAKIIEKAGDAKQALALTHNRGLVGVLVPITSRLMQSLVEHNLSRVIHNISLGEKDAANHEPAKTWLPRDS